MNNNYSDRVLIIEYINDYKNNNLHRSNAMKTLDWLVRNQPKRAWSVIVNLIKNSADDALNAFIAAGPIEDLLVYHSEIITEIEKDAFNNKKLCETLDCVWKNKIKEETWERLQRIIETQWKGENLKMQNMLKEYGCEVEENGFIGPKTIEAINLLRNNTGLPLESVEEIIEVLERKNKG